MRIKTIVVLVILLCLIPVVSGTSFTDCQNVWGVHYCTEVQTAVSGDGKVIAAGSATGIIGTFAPDGSPRWAYDTRDDITSIVISPDGRFIRAGSYHGYLYFFDIDGNLLLRYTPSGNHEMYVTSSDGQSVYDLSGVFNREGTGDPIRQDMGIVRIYHNGTIIPREAALGQGGNTPCPGSLAVIQTSGNYLHYVVGLDNSGIRWERTVPDDSGGIRHVAIATNGCTIAVVDHHSLYVFDPGGEILWNVTPKYLVRSVAVSADGEYVALGTQYKLLYFNRSGSLLWEYSPGLYSSGWYSPAYYFDDIRISGDDRTITAVSEGSEYHLDRNGTLLQNTSPGEGPPADGFTITPVNNTFTITDRSGRTTTVDMDKVPAGPMVTVRPAMPSDPAGAETGSSRVPAGPPTSLPTGIAIIAAGVAGLVAILLRQQR
jgi:hypothetical protein